MHFKDASVLHHPSTPEVQTPATLARCAGRPSTNIRRLSVNSRRGCCAVRRTRSLADINGVVVSAVFADRYDDTILKFHVWGFRHWFRKGWFLCPSSPRSLRMRFLVIDFPGARDYPLPVAACVLMGAVYNLHSIFLLSLIRKEFPFSFIHVPYVF